MLTGRCVRDEKEKGRGQKGIVELRGGQLNEVWPREKWFNACKTSGTREKRAASLTPRKRERSDEELMDATRADI